MEDAEVLEKYQRLKTGNYVQTNSKLHWCPGVDCENAVKVCFVTYMSAEI